MSNYVWISFIGSSSLTRIPNTLRMTRLAMLVGFLFLAFTALSDAARRPKPKPKPKPKKSCLGDNGILYKPGLGYNSGCDTYACTRIGRRYTMIKKFDTKNCCLNKAGAHINIGQIINTQDLGPCSKKIIKCIRNDLGFAAHEIEIHHGDCCNYNGTTVPVGTSFPLPAQCARIWCTNRGQVPTITVRVEYESCHCCLDNEGNLHVDGSNIILNDGTIVNCCDGKWVTVVDIGNPTDPKECWEKCPISPQHLDIIKKAKQLIADNNIHGTAFLMDFSVLTSVTDDEKNYERYLAALLALTISINNPENPLLGYARYKSNGASSCKQDCTLDNCTIGARLTGSYQNSWWIGTDADLDMPYFSLVNLNINQNSQTCDHRNELVILIANSPLNVLGSLSQLDTSNWPSGTRSLLALGLQPSASHMDLVGVANHEKWADSYSTMVSSTYTEMLQLYNTLKCIDEECCKDSMFHYLKKPTEGGGGSFHPAAQSDKKPVKCEDGCINIDQNGNNICPASSGKK